MFINSKIEAIIFDLGDVIYDLDFSRALQAFAELGIPNVETFYGHLAQSDLFNQFDKGNIPAQEFRDQLRNIVGQDISDIDINRAYNALLVGVPEGRHELLLAMKEKYRTFLLSNNNEIHYQSILDYLQEHHGIEDYSNHFEKDYYSHLMGMRKPDTEIFEYVINQHQLNLGETLFLDDSPQHIATAKSLGLQTVLVTKENPLEKIIEEMGL